MRLFLFTNSFPFGLSETFLENELPYLSNNFNEVILIPLFQNGSKRDVPSNVNVWDPILKFNPNNRIKMLWFGIFNIAPVKFALKEFFQKKVYSDKKWFWNFCTSLLLLRAEYSNRKLWENFEKELNSNDRIYFYWGDLSNLMLPFINNSVHCPVVSRFHRTDLYEYAKGGYIPFRSIILPYIDYLLPISNDGQNYLLENYSRIISPKKIKVTRLGVFDNGINPKSIDSATFHLISCSYMVPVKRISLIIESLKLINFDIRWTHIGTGLLHDSIQSEILSLPSNVHVELLGALPNKEVIEYYQTNHIDLFVNVSSSEGVPVSIMEALSFGIPVVATNAGGTGEIVDSKVGELLDIQTSSLKIAETINSFAFQDCSEIRKNARNRWDQLCNAEKNYIGFVDLIKQFNSTQLKSKT